MTSRKKMPLHENIYHESIVSQIILVSHIDLSVLMITNSPKFNISTVCHEAKTQSPEILFESKLPIVSIPFVSNTAYSSFV